MEEIIPRYFELSIIHSYILNDALLQFVKISDELPFSEIPNYLHKIKEEKEHSEIKRKSKKIELVTVLTQQSRDKLELRVKIENGNTLKIQKEQGEWFFKNKKFSFTAYCLLNLRLNMFYVTITTHDRIDNFELIEQKILSEVLISFEQKLQDWS